jgi:hypothetical protein
MHKVRTAIVKALDEIGIAHQDGPENSLVFTLKNVEKDDSISFFVSFLSDDEDFVTMGSHIWDCDQSLFTFGMAIAGNVNATAKVAKVFPLHMPVSDGNCECDGDECDCEMDKPEDCGCGCGTEEEECDCGCGGGQNVRAHFFVTSQFFWTEETMPTDTLTRYINVALAARQDFLDSLKEFDDFDA